MYIFANVMNDLLKCWSKGPSSNSLWVVGNISTLYSKSQVQKHIHTQTYRHTELNTVKKKNNLLKVQRKVNKKVFDNLLQIGKSTWICIHWRLFVVSLFFTCFPITFLGTFPCCCYVVEWIPPLYYYIFSKITTYLFSPFIMILPDRKGFPHNVADIGPLTGYNAKQSSSI